MVDGIAFVVGALFFFLLFYLSLGVVDGGGL